MTLGMVRVHTELSLKVKQYNEILALIYIKSNKIMKA